MKYIVFGGGWVGIDGYGDGVCVGQYGNKIIVK